MQTIADFISALEAEAKRFAHMSFAVDDAAFLRGVTMIEGVVFNAATQEGNPAEEAVAFCLTYRNAAMTERSAIFRNAALAPVPDHCGEVLTCQ